VTDQLEPGAQWSTGPEAVVPRLAATVILLRGATGTIEVLLVQRNPQARFMGGAWVFPGGAVDRDEGEGQSALRAAAVRELAEEAGIRLSDPEQLVLFSHWITPAEAKIRFDTWFYLATLPDGESPRVDGAEVIDARWYEPQAALAAAREEDIVLVFPTIKHLEALSAFSSAEELLERSRTGTVSPIQPRVIRHGETTRVVLPGEPGYDD
jgi:8-oxo-dGTP pyrophosphatase MutT (NUDIX family)